MNLVVQVNPVADRAVDPVEAEFLTDSRNLRFLVAMCDRQSNLLETKKRQMAELEIAAAAGRDVGSDITKLEELIINLDGGLRNLRLHVQEMADNMGNRYERFYVEEVDDYEFINRLFNRRRIVFQAVSTLSSAQKLILKNRASVIRVPFHHLFDEDD